MRVTAPPPRAARTPDSALTAFLVVSSLSKAGRGHLAPPPAIVILLPLHPRMGPQG
jgi:hypothetical protein